MISLLLDTCFCDRSSSHLCLVTLFEQSLDGLQNALLALLHLQAPQSHRRRRVGRRGHHSWAIYQLHVLWDVHLLHASDGISDKIAEYIFYIYGVLHNKHSEIDPKEDTLCSKLCMFMLLTLWCLSSHQCCMQAPPSYCWSEYSFPH